MMKIIALALCMVVIQGAPSPQNQQDPIPQIISFDNGRVGVNFLGFKASAGLGGLLTGNAADGGLHAQAETPYGQRAGAGLGGTVGPNGRTAGGLYAGATAGNGIAARSGIGGVVGESGSFGGSYAGASNGVVVKEVVKHKEQSVAPVVYQKEVQKVAVPTYVEKTVRVPTYEKELVRVQTQDEIRPGSVKVIHKVKSRPHKVHHHKYVSYSSASAPEPVPAPALGSRVNIEKHVAVNKNPEFYNDIFNIPISALGAVNKFLNNLQVSGTKTVTKVSY